MHSYQVFTLPLVLIWYTTPLGSLLSRFSTDYHFYVDDTQFPRTSTAFDDRSYLVSLENLSVCLQKVKPRVSSNKPALNPPESEFLVPGLRVSSANEKT